MILKNETIQKVFVTTGNEEAPTGQIIFFIRHNNDKDMTPKTFRDVCQIIYICKVQFFSIIASLFTGNVSFFSYVCDLNFCFQDFTFGFVDVGNNGGLINSIKTLLKQINLPMLFAYKEWGPMIKSMQGKKNRDEFLQSFESFVNFLESKQFKICKVLKKNNTKPWS